jgi:hypothetical protein
MSLHALIDRRHRFGSQRRVVGLSPRVQRRGQTGLVVNESLTKRAHRAHTLNRTVAHLHVLQPFTGRRGLPRQSHNDLASNQTRQDFRHQGRARSLAGRSRRAAPRLSARGCALRGRTRPGGSRDPTARGPKREGGAADPLMVVAQGRIAVARRSTAAHRHVAVQRTSGRTWCNFQAIGHFYP